MFPFKDAEARKYLLVGGLVSIAAFFIPILPYLVLYGYAVIIARQVLRGESPHMVPWEDWGGMLKDGAKLFGIRMIFSIPILILAMPLFAASFAMPFIAENMDSASADSLITIMSLVMLGTFCILIPLSLPLTVLIPAAEMHMVDNNDFAAGFRLKEWWQIFRANLGGFIVAFGIYYIVSMALVIVMQILVATLIFACLLFILIPAMTIYLTLVMYTTIAIAYRDGKIKLAQSKPTPQTT
ncbi:MAG: DUF4013 domain-containing protein [Chloroflexi bacterium]|nr:DUF4013 domain-containing protein [Chloroflexota bacterium]